VFRCQLTFTLLSWREHTLVTCADVSNFGPLNAQDTSHLKFTNYVPEEKIHYQVEVCNYLPLLHFNHILFPLICWYLKTALILYWI